MTKEQLLPVIYRVMDKLMNLGGTDWVYDKTMTEEQIETGLFARDFGIEEWEWPQGVGLYGLYKLQKYYGDDRYVPFFDNWIRKNLEKGLPPKNVNTTMPFLVVASLLDRLNNPEYEQLCLEHAEWVMHGLPKTKEGGFQHTVTNVHDTATSRLNEGQVWADTLFMTVLFLNKMGHLYDRKDWIDEATRQVLLHIKYLYDKKTCLLHHAWSFVENGNFGEVFWCRGNSWFTYGIMDYLEMARDTLDAGVFTYIADTYRAQCEALRALQAPSGLWHTVLTDPTSYEETSGSGAIVGGMLKGIRMGILDESFKECTERGLAGICSKVAEDGTVLGVSAGTTVGYDADHYRNIIVRPMAYGQSLALVALVEARGEA